MIQNNKDITSNNTAPTNLVGMAVWVVMSLILLLTVSVARADTPVSLTETFAGNMDFALTGGSLRNANDQCLPVNGGQSSGTISVGGGATVEAAYLYWSGNGSSIDTAVTFNGATVSADQTYTSTITANANYRNSQGQGTNGNYTFTYFAAKADVTSRITSVNNTYTVGGLTFQSGHDYFQYNGATYELNPYCANATVYGGWALVIVYEQTSEPLRVVNIFDGFQMFQGSSITLTPNNFIIDSDPQLKEGHHAHITWEGDAGNSQANNNVTEDLFFNGNELVGPNNPSQNQFNSYSNQVGATTSGVDIDSYQVGQYMSEGQTSATTVYSSGQDRVFLSAEILSVPNKNVADLQLTSSGTVAVVRGETTTHTLTVTNNGPSQAPSGTVITIPLSDGLTLDSYSGTSWACSATTAQITCTLNRPISDEATAPVLTINLATSATTQSIINLTATVTGVEFDNKSSNNTATLAMTIGSPDLSGSTKTLDTSSLGSSVSAGDTLTYTITLTNSGNSIATATVTDNIPAEFQSFSVVSAPAGSTVNTYAAPAGSYGAGYFTVSDISVPVSGSASIVMTARISETVASGTSVSNTATIDDGVNSAFNITSESVIIGEARSTSGNKPIYLHTSGTTANLYASRSSDTSADEANYYAIAQWEIAAWTLNPAPQTAISLDYSKTISTTLMLRPNSTNGCTNYNNSSWQRYDRVWFSLYNATTDTLIAEFYQYDNFWLNCNYVTTINVDMGIINQGTISAGDSLQVRVQYGNTTNRMRVYNANGGTNSQVRLNSKTIIQVDQLGAYTAAYPNGSRLTEVMETSAVYFRAVVSDPFGYADISEVRWTVTDNNDNVIIDNQVITPASSSGAISVYQIGPFNVADDTAVGDWSISVTADEGDEGFVSAKRKAIIEVVGRPEPVVIKTVETQWDPINLYDNPKAIPGSYQVYTLTIRNEGDGEITADSISLVDPIEGLVPFFVQGNLDQTSTVPFLFTDGAVSSGLSFTYTALDDTADDIDFSTDGSDYTYDPSVAIDAEGFNADVSHVRFTPKGTMNAAIGTQYPEFTLKYKVKVE